MRAMFLVILCATIAVAVLVYMLLVSRPDSGARQRRYPRMELTIPVDIHTHDDKHLGETRNISLGGMLLHAHAPVSISQPIRLKFTLPPQAAVEVPAVVTYKKGQQIGVRFDPTHYTRAEIEKWIELRNRASNREPSPASAASQTAPS